MDLVFTKQSAIGIQARIIFQFHRGRVDEFRYRQWPLGTAKQTQNSPCVLQSHFIDVQQHSFVSFVQVMRQRCQRFIELTYAAATR